MSDKSITEKVDMILEKLDEKEDSKKFKKLKLSKSKKKKGFVSAIILRTNGNIDIKKLLIFQDMVYLKDSETYHVGSSEYIFNYKGNPTMIIPEFSLVPLSIKELRADVDRKGYLSYAQRIVINAVEQSQIKKKTQISGKVLLIGIGVVVAAIFILSEVL